MRATARNFIRLNRLDYSANYAYAPPTVDSLLSVNLILKAVPVETRLTEKCVSITLIGGTIWTCVGTVDKLSEVIKEAQLFEESESSA